MGTEESEGLGDKERRGGEKVKQHKRSLKNPYEAYAFICFLRNMFKSLNGITLYLRRVTIVFLLKDTDTKQKSQQPEVEHPHLH